MAWVGIRRNNAMFDIWSLVHCLTGVLMGWIMPPQTALLLMVLWEPLEILIISPIVGRRGVVFGYETLKNSVSDIAADSLGIIIGMFWLAEYFEPPIHLFQ